MKTNRTKPAEPELDSPAPDRGGAWIRQADGSLIRDPDEEQHIPKGEKAGKPVEPAAADVPPAPVAETAAKDQEG